MYLCVFRVICVLYDTIIRTINQTIILTKLSNNEKVFLKCDVVCRIGKQCITYSVVETVELSGNVEGTMTLDAETEYILAGTLTVPDGATLEIPAGTKIKAKQGFGNYIIVAQGGKINARGTAQAPIIFTAEDESNAGPGYWGGLIINGKAPISGPAGTTATY